MCVASAESFPLLKISSATAFECPAAEPNGICSVPRDNHGHCSWGDVVFLLFTLFFFNKERMMGFHL